MKKLLVLLAVLCSFAFSDEQILRLRLGVPVSGGGGGGAISAITWTNMTHTTGWPGFNGYLSLHYDAVSGEIIHYGIPPTSVSIYSTGMFNYNVAANDWDTILDVNHTGDDCITDNVTSPDDRHPVGQMAVDTLRHRLWLFGGVCTPQPRNDMWYFSLNANPATDTWTEVTISNIPTILVSGMMVYDNDNDVLVLIGANTSSTAYEVWVYCPSASLSGNQTTAGCGGPQDWYEVTDFTGGGPTGSQFTRAVYSNVIDKIAIFGGITGGGVTKNEPWTYNVLTHTFTQRCTSPCTNPPMGDDISVAFIEIPSASVFFFHQFASTGAPKDWQLTLGATAADDVWAVIPDTGDGPTSNCESSYDPTATTVVLWCRNAGSGEADVWQGVLSF